MTLSETRVKAILDGTEGITAGPWQAEEGADQEGVVAIIGLPTSGMIFIAPLRPSEYATGVDEAGVTHDDQRAVRHAKYIANCDPETISALCRDNLALREALAEIAGKKLASEMSAVEYWAKKELDFQDAFGACVARARAALEPTP